MIEQLDFIPQPQHALFYVCLSDVSNLTLTQTLNLLTEKGYKPELKYLEMVQTKRIKLFAVLKDVEMSTPSDEGVLLSEEYDNLLTHIQPSTAVRLAWGHVPELAAV